MVAIVLVALLTFAAWHDLRSREVPDWISVAILVWTIVIVALGWQPTGWFAVVTGAILGFALSAPLFWLGGVGGGDVKLVTALGACLGPWGLLQTLFWVAVAGGVLALVAKLRRQTDFAYVPAILVGVVLHCAASGVLHHAR